MKRNSLSLTFKECSVDILEKLGVNFQNKEVKYGAERTILEVRYNNCFVDKELWNIIRNHTETSKIIINDIKIENSKKYNHYIRCYSDGSNTKDSCSFGAVMIHSNLDENVIDTTCVLTQECEEGKTNSIGELTGAIEILEETLDLIKNYHLYGNILVELCSDSNYVINGLTMHARKQEKRGWTNYDGKPTPNKELWIKALNLFDEFLSLENVDIACKWTKGHKLKIADRRIINEEEFFDNLEIPVTSDILEDSPLISGTNDLNIIMNEFCDILAKQALNIKI